MIANRSFLLGPTFRKLRLFFGFVFIVAFLLLARPTRLTLLAAMPLWTVGLGMRAWAAGHLVKRKILTRSGPYAHTRNPLYFGSLFLLIGACAAARSMWLWLVFVPLYVVIHVIVIAQEQQLNLDSFGDDFVAYAAAVPAFLPSLRARLATEPPWSFRRYLKNGEYNAGIGVLAAMAFLMLRWSGRL